VASYGQCGGEHPASPRAVASSVAEESRAFSKAAPLALTHRALSASLIVLYEQVFF